MLRWLFLVIVACGGSPPPDDEYADIDHEMPCDPFMEEVAVEIEPEPAPVCGDGRATSQRTSCTQSCSVGCGTEGQCTDIECEHVRERCDGDDIAIRPETDQRWQCADNGYLPGPAVCTSECEIDWSRCSICEPREGLRCATVELDAGRAQPILVDLGRRVAVVARNPTNGNLVGGYVDARLRFRAWDRPLAESTKAAVAWDGEVAYVAEDGSLNVVDVVRRRTRSIASAPSTEMGGYVILLPEHEGSGIAVAWQWLHSSDVAFAVLERDGSPPEFESPRYFRHDDQRLLVGQLREARAINSIELEAGALVAVAARAAAIGVVSSHLGTFRFHGAVDHAELDHARIRAQWRDQTAFDQIQLAGEDIARQFEFTRQVPEAEGLASVATAGGRWIDAFGGVLIANAVHTPETLGLYLLRD